MEGGVGAGEQWKRGKLFLMVDWCFFASLSPRPSTHKKMNSISRTWDKAKERNDESYSRSSATKIMILYHLREWNSSVLFLIYFSYYRNKKWNFHALQCDKLMMKMFFANNRQFSKCENTLQRWILISHFLSTRKKWNSFFFFSCWKKRWQNITFARSRRKWKFPWTRSWWKQNN